MKQLQDEKLFRTIRNFLTVYLPEQRLCSKHTIKSYRESLNLLFLFLQQEKSMALYDVTFASINAATIQEYLSWLETNRNCSISTRNHRLACIRSFFQYAGKMDLALIDCLNEIKKVPVKKSGTLSTVEFLSEAALQTVLREPDTTTEKGIRDMFYMILLYDSGARNQELLDLKVNDMNLIPGSSSISVTGKGDKRRMIPIMDKTAEHCKKYLDLFHGDAPDKSQYLFYTVRQGKKQQMSDDNVSRFMRQYGHAARQKCEDVPEKVHPHLFRHTRAMHLYQGGMPLALVAEWLGHAQLETTLIYAHADTEMKRRAIEKATTVSNPIHHSDLIDMRPWKNDEQLIRQLYGLS